MRGAENGFSPFFSPDGQHLGFFTSEGLMRVAVTGGPATRLVETSPVSRGGGGARRLIVLCAVAVHRHPRVKATGGGVESLTDGDAAQNSEGHVWPDVSADGEVLLYVARRGESFAAARIVARSVSTGEQRVVVEGGTYARFAAAGRLVFAREATLFAAEFDAKTLSLRGLPQPILHGVQGDPFFGGAYYATARDHGMIYVPGDARPPGRMLLWVTPGGVESAAFPEARTFLMPSVSPDGSAVVVTLEGSHQDLWRFDTARPVLRRLTSSPGEDFGAVWSRDGRRLAYTSVRQGQEPAVYMKPADTLDGEKLLTEASVAFPNTWSADGRCPPLPRRSSALPGAEGHDWRCSDSTARRFCHSTPRRMSAGAPRCHPTSGAWRLSQSRPAAPRSSSRPGPAAGSPARCRCRAAPARCGHVTAGGSSTGAAIGCWPWTSGPVRPRTRRVSCCEDISRSRPGPTGRATTTWRQTGVS